MDCEEIKNLLSEYVDNEIDNKTLAEVKQHLESCSSCMEETLKLKVLKQRIMRLGNIKAPQGFTESVKHKINMIEQPPKKYFFQSVQYKLASVAAVGLILFIVIYNMRYLYNPFKMGNKVEFIASKSNFSSLSGKNMNSAASDKKKDTSKPSEIDKKIGSNYIAQKSKVKESDKILYEYEKKKALNDENRVRKYADLNNRKENLKRVASHASGVKRTKAEVKLSDKIISEMEGVTGKKETGEIKGNTELSIKQINIPVMKLSILPEEEKVFINNFKGSDMGLNRINVRSNIALSDREYHNKELNGPEVQMVSTDEGVKTFGDEIKGKLDRYAADSITTGDMGISMGDIRRRDQEILRFMNAPFRKKRESVLQKTVLPSAIKKETKKKKNIQWDCEIALKLVKPEKRLSMKRKKTAIRISDYVRIENVVNEVGGKMLISDTDTNPNELLIKIDKTKYEKLNKALNKLGTAKEVTPLKKESISSRYIIIKLNLY